MANELRVRANFLGGAVEDNPLASTATTMTSAALAVAPAIGTTQYLPITLDPDGFDGIPEIAWITAHTAGANTATLLRGQEGTAARACYQDTPWVHSATTQDAGKTDTQVARDLAQTGMTGGGAITWDGMNLAWNARFIPIAFGMGGHWSTNGYYDIYQPTSGTIPGYGGAAAVTATGSGVPIPAWNALYFIPGVGGNNTAGSFAVVNYSGNFVVPSHWIMVAVHNGDDSSIRLGTGQTIGPWITPSLLNGWTVYGAPYGPANYAKINDVVYIRGLVTPGTVTQGTPIFNLAAGYRPLRGLLIPVVQNDVFGQIRIGTGGNVMIWTGSAGFFSVTCNFVAEA